MPTTLVTVAPTAATQPVKLALAAAWLRLDDALVTAATSGDTSTLDPPVALQLDGLALQLAAACAACEGYTGRLFAGQTVQVTYSVYEPYLPPIGGTATAVSGFITDLADLANLGGYLEEYRKGISIERQLPFGYTDCGPTFTVTFTIDPAQCPALAQSAILELTGEWYRNREVTLADVRTVVELPASYKVKLAPLRVAPLGNY